MKSLYKLPVAAMFLLAASLIVSAQANKVQDLVGGRASSGETTLEDRGWVLTHSDKSDEDAYGYWWHGRDKKCVVVRTNDGRYASIVDTMNTDCNQKENTGLSTGAKVGIGAAAAAIIGAAVIAHKAHNHDDGKHYNNANQEAEYDRGYRDGLYNSSYHDYNNTDQYRSGYAEGVAQRRDELPHYSGRGGNTGYVNVSDLEGARASSGESQMQSRGFRNVDGFKSGNTSYTIWWNGRTRQCIQVATANGVYDSVMDIGTNPNCR